MRLYLLTFLCCITLSLFSQETIQEVVNESEMNFYEIQRNAQDYFQKNLKSGEDGDSPSYDKAYHRYKRWEWYWENRVNSDGTFPDLRKKYNAYNEFNRQLKSGSNEDKSPEWLNINQKTCTGGYNGMGRTTAIAFHPTNSDIFYVGAPIGGIWKTEDGGKTYAPKGDNLPHVGVGSIAINYNNPDEMYISISDNSGWWNYSLGVYKSVDAGETWQATGLTFNFQDGVAIYTLAINPENPEILMAATSGGLWRTKNSGANWVKVKETEWNDVKYRPGDGSTIYAAKEAYWNYSQIYRSDNGGDTWQKLSSFTEKKTKLRLAVTPANPDMLVAMSTANKAIYISKNKGNNLIKKADAEETQFIYVSPFNEDIIYHGYVSVYQSKDGGNSSNKITMWYGGTELPEVHADHHFANYNPLNGYLYFCNDGGVYRYHEQNNTWKEFSNGLVITQYYKLAVAQTDPVLLIGGTQDNGGRKRNDDGSWSSTNGGDAMEVAIDPHNENIFYTTYCNGELFRTTDGWKSHTKISNNIPGEPEGSWVTPYVLDPSNSEIIVAGYSDVFRSTNRGSSWTQISTNLTGEDGKNLKCIAVAPSNSNVVFASRKNTMYKTSDLGENWKEINYWINNENITSILVQHKSADTLWVSFGGYNDKKVFQSNNGGIIWTDISSNLPEVPVNTLVCDTTQKFNALYAGTDMGVFFKNDTMETWKYYGTGLPNTSVTDIDIQYNTKKLRISTYGRGIWETTLKGAQINQAPEVHLLTPEAELHVSAGEKIQLSAEASDSDGEVEKVVFFNGSIKLGEVKSEPYEINLNAMPAGDYSLFARAIDNRGTVSETERVSLYVECPQQGKLNGNIIGTDGTWGGDATKDKAMDGNINTYFDANQKDGAWVGFAFSQEKKVQGIRFYPRKGQRYRMIGGKFQGTNTAGFNSNVTTFYEINSKPSLEWNCINISIDQTFKYIRYVSPIDGYGNVSEVEFYGTGVTYAQDISMDNETVVFPNPFTDKLEIKHQLSDITVSVSNSAGIIIPCKVESTQNSTKIIFPDNCKNGMYYISIQSDKEVYFHKVLKVR